MSETVRALLAFGGAALLAVVTVESARRLALATGFLDHPRDYRRHSDATPYLGGAGVLTAAVVVAIAVGGALESMATVLSLALILGVMGTADDRHLLGPGLRFAVQIGAALALWFTEIRWEPTGSALIDLPITLLWVVGLTNAFNLLDNIDGAAATTAAVSSAGIGAISLHQGSGELAAVAFALSGACTTFLLFNLSSSRKIFLGDGGSLPIGFLIAVMAMLLPGAHPDVALLAAVPLVGAAIFDTALVVISRRRRGVNVLSGGRDHSTHRLLSRLGSPSAVCLTIGAATAALSVLAYAMYDMSSAGVLLATAAYVSAGVILLAAFEGFAPAPDPVPDRGEQAS